MHIVITGGAGFIGSNLADWLITAGHSVTLIDNCSTGSINNIQHLLDNPSVTFLNRDVTEGLAVPGPIHAVCHFASPASPPDYLRLPLETMKVGSLGTFAALDLARAHHARFIMASTSEVYGDPEIHPQHEGYWGRVNPIGPRSVYDEAKRFSEAATMAYRTTWQVNTGLIRIFNTFGPRMRLDDGRAIPNFITQCIRNEPLTIYGDGSQTRSICYVDDLVRGIAAMILSDSSGPINLGNPEEISMLDLAKWIRELTGSKSSIVYEDLPQDDPLVRRPDIAKAQQELHWKPQISAKTGLERTIAWFRTQLT